jgi:hypothetical protein
MEHHLRAASDVQHRQPLVMLTLVIKAVKDAIEFVRCEGITGLNCNFTTSSIDLPKISTTVLSRFKP